MPDVFDVELQKSEEEARRAPLPALVPLSWVAAALLAVAIVIAGYYWNSRAGDGLTADEVTVTVIDAAPQGR